MTPLERECKIPVPEREGLAERLRALGAEDEGDRHEQNWVFDDARNSLRDREMLLRLRVESGVAGALLTVKRPVPEAAGGYKVREEVEARFTDLAEGRRALEALGYHETWFYEKRRRALRYAGCHIALDEMPELGAFIEVEGEREAAITAVLLRLGLDPSTHVAENYRALFARRCAARGEGERDLRFSPDLGA